MVKKLKFYKNFKISSTHKKSILLVGNFDGLHLGHQKLFNLAKKYKKKFKLKIGVITFEPMPKMYFNKNLKNFRISNIHQKIKILEKLDIDFLITKKFNKHILKIAMKDEIPKNILNRKKRGFTPPLINWLNNSLSDLESHYLSEKKIKEKVM